MTRTIWVVEQGNYSDYRVVGVFSTKENAQLVADAINKDTAAYDKAEVDEWPLDPAVDELNKGMRLHRVVMRKDGTVEQCDAQDSITYSSINDEVRMWYRTRATAYRNEPNVEDALMATVWATDDTHAVKIVNEHRTRFIAEDRWDWKEGIE